MKAMILAAGRGERMQPLTTHTPKPLVSVGKTPLIDHALSEIKKANIQDVVINVHHLGDQIRAHCGDGKKYGLHIQYSIETELLNTGGGIYRALPLLGASPFIALSADLWTDFPLATLIQKQVNYAHLILVKNPDFHAKGDFGLDKNGIVHNNAPQQFTYANIAVLHPRLFAHNTEMIFPLSRPLRYFIEKKCVTGELYSGVWHNVGTVEQLAAISNSQIIQHKSPITDH